MKARPVLAAMIGLGVTFFVFDLIFGQFGARAMANYSQAPSYGRDVAKKTTASNPPESENHRTVRHSLAERVISKSLPPVAGVLGLTGLGLLLYELLPRRRRSLGNAAHLAASRPGSGTRRRRRASAHAGLPLQPTGSGMTQSQSVPDEVANRRELRRAA